MTVFIALEMFGDLRKIVKIFEDDLRRARKVWSLAWSDPFVPPSPVTKFE